MVVVLCKKAPGNAESQRGSLFSLQPALQGREASWHMLVQSPRQKNHGNRVLKKGRCYNFNEWMAAARIPRSYHELDWIR